MYIEIEYSESVLGLKTKKSKKTFLLATQEGTFIGDLKKNSNLRRWASTIRNRHVGKSGAGFIFREKLFLFKKISRRVFVPDGIPKDLPKRFTEDRLPIKPRVVNHNKHKNRLRKQRQDDTDYRNNPSKSLRLHRVY